MTHAIPDAPHRPSISQRPRGDPWHCRHGGRSPRIPQMRLSQKSWPPSRSRPSLASTWPLPLRSLPSRSEAPAARAARSRVSYRAPGVQPPSGHARRGYQCAIFPPSFSRIFFGSLGSLMMQGSSSFSSSTNARRGGGGHYNAWDAGAAADGPSLRTALPVARRGGPSRRRRAQGRGAGGGERVWRRARRWRGFPRRRRPHARHWRPDGGSVGDVDLVEAPGLADRRLLGPHGA